jgi:hypothetical protein
VNRDTEKWTHAMERHETGHTSLTHCAFHQKCVGELNICKVYGESDADY